MKNTDSARKGVVKNAQAGQASEQQTGLKAPERWVALEGPGLPVNVEKQGLEAGLPKGLVSLLSESLREASKMTPKLSTGEPLKLARELWIETTSDKLALKVGNEKALEVVSLVESVFPAGKDFENAVAWRSSLVSNFTSKAINLLCIACKADDFLLANEWGQDKGSLLLSFEARKLACNLAAVYGGLKKFYVWQADRACWVSVKALREEREGAEEGEVVKPKSKVDLSKLGNLSFE